jgi:hypothetical protein
VIFLGINLNTSMPVALGEMEQKSNVRHCGRSLQNSQNSDPCAACLGTIIASSASSRKK